MNKSISLMALLLVLSAGFVSAEVVTTRTAHSQDTGKVFENSAISGMVVSSTADAPWWRRIGRNEQRNTTLNQTRPNIEALRNSKTVASDGRVAFNTSCIQAAVDAREDAITAALDSYTSSVKTALSARKTNLDHAWANQDKAARKSAVDGAWSAYKAAVKAAAAEFNSERETAWKQYAADAKVCKADISSDPANANVDKLVMS